MHGLHFSVFLVESLTIGYKWPSYFPLFGLMSWLAMARAFGSLSGIQVHEEKTKVTVRPYSAISRVFFITVQVVPLFVMKNFFVEDQPILRSDAFGRQRKEPMTLVMAWIYMIPVCLLILNCFFAYFDNEMRTPNENEKVKKKLLEFLLLRSNMKKRITLENDVMGLFLIF